MNLWIGLQTILESLRTNTVKSLRAENAAGNTRQEESETAESAQNVSGKELSSVVRMTKETAKQKLCDWCRRQVGYHEAWDGSNQYADGQWDVKLYGFSALNVPWCDVFVDAAFISVFGFADATAMTYQQPAGFAACSLSADAYRNHGAFTQKPEVGDQIFFLYGNGINHTGIVVAVNGNEIQCVEGNYADGVALTKYQLGNRIIAGFGRPDWSVVCEPDKPAPDFSKVDDTQFDIIHPKHRRTYFHLEYGDGSNTPMPQVRAWQNLLLCWGFDIGQYGADGEFGLDTENATRKWQEAVLANGADVEVNGIVDEDDWQEIIFVECGGDSDG